MCIRDRNYTESFKLTDTKLYIGYSIVVVSAVSFLLDKQLGHRNVIPYQQGLVAAYIILSSLFWYFKKYVEKSITYVGNEKKTDDKISICTRYEECEPKYFVTFVKNDEESSKLEVVLETTKVFNEAGYLQTDLLYNWFSEQLKIISLKKKE